MPSPFYPGRNSAPTDSSPGVQYQPGAPPVPAAGNLPDGSGGGVFAAFLQGASPKYAQNVGPRGDTQHRNTLSRLLIRVDASEQQLFLNSIGDGHVKTHLAPRIAGDPTPGENNALLRGNGYVDFLLQQVQMPMQENYQVVPTLADNHVDYFFGQAPPIWSFAGKLINTRQDDQASNMMRLYLEMLRGTALARRQKVVSIIFDSYIVTGTLCSYVPVLASDNEILVSFSFQMIVKKISIVNFTRGWNPTSVHGAFTTDLNAIAYDGRPRIEPRVLQTVGAVPPGQEVTPTPQTQADPRVNNAPPPPNDGHEHAPPLSPVSSTGAGAQTSDTGPTLVFAPARNISPAARALGVGSPETLNAQYSTPPNVSSNSNLSSR